MLHAQTNEKTTPRCTCEVVVDRVDLPMGGRQVSRVQMGDRTVIAVQPLTMSVEVAAELAAVLTEEARARCGGRCQASTSPTRQYAAAV